MGYTELQQFTIDAWGRPQPTADAFGEIAIDELELFSRSIAPEQIQAIFNIGAAGKCRSVGEGMQ